VEYIFGNVDGRGSIECEGLAVNAEFQFGAQFFRVIRVTADNDDYLFVVMVMLGRPYIQPKSIYARQSGTRSLLR